MNVGLAIGLLIISAIGAYSSIVGKFGSVLASLFAPELLAGPVQGPMSIQGSYQNTATGYSYGSTANLLNYNSSPTPTSL